MAAAALTSSPSVVARGGRFSATNLPPGQYGLAFFGLTAKHRGCGPSPYATQQFFRQGFGATLDLVSVPGGKVTAGVDAEAVAGRQGHRRRAEQGGSSRLRHLRDRDEPAHGREQPDVQRRPRPVHRRRPDPGRYQVEFSSCGGDFPFLGITGVNYANQWYKNHSSQSAANLVAVRPASTTANIDAALAKGGDDHGSGRLQADQAAGLLRMRLRVHPGHEHAQREPDRPARPLLRGRPRAPGSTSSSTCPALASPRWPGRSGPGRARDRRPGRPQRQ